MILFLLPQPPLHNHWILLFSITMPLATIFAYKYPPLRLTFTSVEDVWNPEYGQTTSHFSTQAISSKNKSKMSVLFNLVLIRLPTACTYVIIMLLHPICK